MSEPLHHTIYRKVTCHGCNRFVGLITSDGRGPRFESCLDSRRNSICPMFDQLDQYQPQLIEEENEQWTPPDSMKRPAAKSNHD